MTSRYARPMRFYSPCGEPAQARRKAPIRPRAPQSRSGEPKAWADCGCIGASPTLLPLRKTWPEACSSLVFGGNRVGFVDFLEEEMKGHDVEVRTAYAVY